MTIDQQKPQVDNESSEQQPEQEYLGFIETTQSVLYAMLGVQKRKNAERDFRKGKASHFIVIGVAFGVLFVCTIASVVSLILSQLT